MNAVFLTAQAKETLVGLSPEVRERARDVLERLERDDLKDAQRVNPSTDPPVFEIYRGPFRLLFSFVHPQSSTREIMILGVYPWSGFVPAGRLRA